MLTITYHTFIEVILSSTAVYIAALVYARIVGLRSFAKISTPDFVMTVAIGSMIANAALSKSVGPLKGAVGIGCIFLLQVIFTKLRLTDKIAPNLLENSPKFLMFNGEFISKNMKECRVSRKNLISKLRESNVNNIDDVKAVVFETTGDLSIIQGHESYDPRLFEGVESLDEVTGSVGGADNRTSA